MADPDPLTSAECAAVFRAMADASRQRILRVLFDAPRSVSAICAALDLEQSFVSRHLAVLRNAGLVTAERDAQRMIYALHPAVHRELAAGDAIDLGCCEVRFKAVEGDT